MANKSDMDIAFLGVLHLCVFAKMSPLAPATRKTFPALKILPHFLIFRQQGDQLSFFILEPGTVRQKDPSPELLRL